MTKQMTDAELALRIMPTSARWPSAATHKTIAWDQLREAREQLRVFVRNVDHQCATFEQDRDLSADGIVHRRSDLGRKAVDELEDWPPLIAAEKTVAKNIDDLEAKMVALPSPPKDATEMTLALAVAEHLKVQKHPASWLLDHGLADARVLQPAMHLPRFLTGLSAAELGVIREKARRALHPVQAQHQDDLKRALADLRSGVEATRRLLRERCHIPTPTSVPDHKQSEPAA